MELTYQEVQETMAGWSIRYREAGYSPGQLEFLSEEYYDDLIDESISSASFKVISRIVRKRCKFFPKVADILEAKEQYCRHPERYVTNNNLQIADTSSELDQTPEEISLSLKLRDLAVRAVTGKMSTNESLQLQKELLEEKKKFSGRLKK